MNNDPRAMTPEEMRDVMLQQLVSYVRYWGEIPAEFHREGFNLPPIPPGMESTVRAYMKHATEGLLHSILVVFDGGSMSCPALDIIPAPHESDKQYHINEGEDWWDQVVINDCQLHDLYNAKFRLCLETP